MSSYENTPLLGSPPKDRATAAFRKGNFLLGDEGPPPLSPHGQGTLAHLIRNNRSQNSLHYGSTWRPSGAGYDQPADLEAGTDSESEPTRRSFSEERRLSHILNSDQVRSMRLIGSSNPRYNWRRYWKTEEQLAEMKTKPIREYYERTNYLIQQYMYIDRLLDSSLPHDLLNEYNTLPPSHFQGLEVPDTISEEPSSTDASSKSPSANGHVTPSVMGSSDSAAASKKVKRTPRDIYRQGRAADPAQAVEDEEGEVWDETLGPKPEIPWLEDDDDVDSGDRIVSLAIYVNFAANAILLAGKIAVIMSVPSMSVLASLVDAVLDFLSTVIVWTTTWLISRQDQYKYPVGRRRLEPLGVLVFSIIMITAFTQVALESSNRLMGTNREVIELTLPSLIIMSLTVVIKGLCWLWCRLVNNSSVQALAADAMTDVIFNMGSILFPIAGFFAHIWWLDALGGLVLSLVVIFNWSQTSLEHIKNLSGFSATADQRNVLLYLTMRFAKTIKQIQGLQAYHAGDKLNVEVDIVLDHSTPLKDSHDLSESLSYVLESVPIVDRAFVHTDYASWNLPTHMAQQTT
ncbi:cation diffusion facilitator 10 [Apiospora kogelbergensis]|uniref:Cation diffusion facilitator 10 n=1 Tax=Apiospora kogelbergensis TaxID=1337665 RepID=A0AAW0QDN8_9PEZI